MERYLSLTLFSLTCFNRAARNNPSFWRPLAYNPNLTHRKGKADPTESIGKIRNEHKCLVLAFQSLVDLNNPKHGLKACVEGCGVSGQAWIHSFIGGTEGNNK